MGEWARTDEVDFCGEWADKNITPEQADRRELVRRFAAAITEGWYASDDQISPDFPADVWKRAEAIADAENWK